MSYAVMVRKKVFKMDIDLFDFELPKELIAQEPIPERSSSRLLLVNKRSKTYQDKIFKDIVDYLKPGDVLVRNNTKVLPVRLFGRKVDTGARVEILLLKKCHDNIWECLVGNAKVVKNNTVISFARSSMTAKCIEKKEEGICLFEFSYVGLFLEELEKIGEMPLPPYIHKKLTNSDRYQTVYASIIGSAAAPTAGFHFTQELFDRLAKKGVEILDITLHIGLGTFKPVKETTIEDHQMHSEYYEISEEVANKLNAAKKDKRRIIAVGTTSTRTLEANYKKYGCFKAARENTNIFIYPGYSFSAIDALITNFHLPKSTLIMLVSAFMGIDLTMKAYRHAIKEKYRFFSFGDAMFIYDE